MRRLLVGAALLGLGLSVFFVFRSWKADSSSRPERSATVELVEPIAMGAFRLPRPQPDGRLRKSQALPFDDEERTVRIDAGTFLAPVRIRGSGSIELDARFPGAAEGKLRLSILDVKGERHPLVAVEASPDESWTTHRAILPQGLQGLQLLLVEAELGEGDSVELRAPRLDLVVPEERRRLRAGRPNIVVVLLDAARARNLGAYGYERDTTPAIDALASEGLVFTRAYSECPATACSIPNLISGLPFVHRQTGEDELRVDDRVETLAESLHEIGYYTIALSSNPKNSRARNSDQGFDEFHELWKAGRRRPLVHTDPHRLTREAVEAMSRVPDSRPLFMQLHYVPPHEPYDPLPEFDLFGDPEYDGVVVPGLRLKAVRSGRLELDDADVAELLALYDGNLRMADDAVGQLFEALRAAGRWDETVVLVTADHGEAFYEHGEQGHNTSLYDEMLHVPFVLRLPDAGDRTGVDTEQLVTLGDVVPTMLGLVGLTPAAEVDGVDLLAGSPDPNRILFHRRVPYCTRYAVRTRYFKAHVADDARPMLFDLRRDPSERTDVSREHPLVVDAYRVLLERHLAAVETLALTSDEPVRAPEVDLESLRDLGYVN